MVVSKNVPASSDISYLNFRPVGCILFAASKNCLASVSFPVYKANASSRNLSHSNMLQNSFFEIVDNYVANCRRCTTPIDW